MIKEIFILAAAYVGLGWLATLLAIPPGYATALFPPAGLALSVLLLRGNSRWPGVWLGSFLLNATIAAFGPNPVGLVALGSAVSIGAGAALTALTGTALVRHYVPRFTVLDQTREILLFLLVGGGVSCLISATWGTGTLWVAGVVPTEKLSFHLWTWYVGDLLGVVVVAPLTIVVMLRTRVIWRPRLYSIVVPGLVALAAAAAIFAFARRAGEEGEQAAFRAYAATAHSEIRESVHRYLQTVSSLARFIRNRKDMDERSFSLYVTNALERQRGIDALEWVPRVTHSQRARFEAERRRRFPGFEITQHDAHGRLERADVREEYFPVLFVQPLAKNRTVYGFDIGSTERRRRSLVRARDNGESSATAAIDLVQASRHRKGFLAVAPVYRHEAIPAEIEQRRKLLRGYAVGVFRIHRIIAPVMRKRHKSFSLVAEDLYEPSHKRAFYFFGPVRANRASLGHSLSVTVADRLWLLRYFADDSHPLAQTGMTSYLVLAGSLLFVGLLQVFLLQMTGQNRRVVREVQRRTRELRREVQSREEAELSLRSSEGRLRGILDRAYDCIITTDEQARIQTMNASGERMFERPAKEVIGQPLTLLLEPPSQGWGGELAGALKQDQAGHEIEGRRRSGKRFPIEMNVSSFEMAQTRLYILVLRDISERKRLDGLKSQFVSTVSHELRTPLTSIHAALGLVSGGALGELPPKAMELLKVAWRNSERLGALIDDLLDIEKIDSGRMQFSIAPLDLVEAVRAAITVNQSYADSLNVGLWFKEPHTPARVLADAKRFGQVLTNLISNGAKFSRDGSVIEISIEQKADRYRVLVRDYGEGVPEAFRDRIFGRFAQADGSDSRPKGGTGLGLSIARSLMTGMGGRVDYFDPEGGGACFFVELPAAKA